MRKDDQPETIKKRLAVDKAAATPLLRYYRRGRRLYRVNGAGPLETVFQRTVALFRRRSWLRP